jgi:uncharacterized protein (TIGR02594 family)
MPSDSVRLIQQALQDQGFDPGDVDGVWGRNTIAAVMRLQEARGLKADGVFGPKTRAVLFAGAAAGPAGRVLLPWFEEAKHLIGTKEVAGLVNNPDIMSWSDDLDLKYQGDDVPWCGLFVAHCIGATLPQEPLPGNPLGARQWERFGGQIQPCEGAVMVFWRGSPSSGKGHVGFYAGEDDTAYQILGGNQSDSVCLTWIDKGRLLQSRWPNSGSSLKTGPVRKTRNQGLSTNEA